MSNATRWEKSEEKDLNKMDQQDLYQNNQTSPLSRVGFSVEYANRPREEKP